MCGRFTLVTTAQDLAEAFEVEINKSLSPRYNIAPSQSVLVIRQDEAEKRILDAMQWGLVPIWVKDLNSWKGRASPLSSTQGRVARRIPRNLINARGAETVGEKPSFKGAFKYRPCLIPTSGFYEWTKDKQPYYYQVRERPLFALAGVWESWSNGSDKLVTCTIITTKANEEAAKVHHRMPVIIQPQDYDSWLGGLDERKQLLDALPEVDLNLYPVSKMVNSPKNDQSECIEPINS
ncbi:MAG TPA: SOS response-associated peptidase [Xenococcaceae cyanobacterium]